ncbi:DNA cytosine methyltransferase [Martelella limonii]|uniref:DNA cytosine methyltransferase n=1 Tax=Martelella limonii TaxID=1647649 RepID=UPI0015805539
MIYGSVCSGIEAASVAWGSIGWRPEFFSEIDPFPSAVLRHHYPETPNLGDMTEYEEWPDHVIDVLVGGTPCQDNSIGYAAGAKRAGDGMDGARSGLAFDFAGIAGRYEPEWVVWENVPNTLSARHSGGFLRFLSELGDAGYFCSWRVIDGRCFGLSDQPRKRLVVVGNRSDWRRAAAVLLEPEGTTRNSEKVASTAPVLTARGGMALDDRTPCILDEYGARLSTPLEWERAMGFPDHYTAIRWRGKPSQDCPDGPRWKALGNSMEVRMMRWIGSRIEAVQSMTATLKAE